MASNPFRAYDNNIGSVGRAQVKTIDGIATEGNTTGVVTLSRPSASIKMRLLIYATATVLSVLCLRIFYLQVVEGATYRDRSEGNRITEHRIPAPRGVVYDSAGNILAKNIPNFTLRVTATEMLHRTHPNYEEFFTLEQLIERFTLENVNKSGAIFETEKLDWMNQHYLRGLSTADILRRMSDVAEHINPNEEGKEEENANKKQLYNDFIAWFGALDSTFQEAIMGSMKERSKTLLDMARSVELVEKASAYEAADLIWKKGTKESTLAVYDALIEQLEAREEGGFLRAQLEPEMIEWIKTTEWGNGDVLWPMRYALSGEQRSPSPFELAEMLGKDETIRRLHIAKEALSMA